jgi:hypothetical protein
VKASEDGCTFECAEFDDTGYWADFDEKNGQSCSVAEFKSNFIKIKGK